MYKLIIAIYVLHIIVCLALILIVLLQTGKGSDLGAAFGGGSSQTLFGSSGRAGALGKLTAGAAVVFMVTCLFLAWFSSQRYTRGVMKDVEASPPPESKTTMVPGAVPPSAPLETQVQTEPVTAEPETGGPVDLDESIPVPAPAPAAVEDTQPAPAVPVVPDQPATEPEAAPTTDEPTP